MTEEVKFKREAGRNYMVAPGAGGKGRYSANMLLENRMKGLLPFHMKTVDGEEKFYYEITSRQPLGKILEYRNLTGKELERLLTGMLRTLAQLEQYLLDESEIWLSPESVYVDADTFDCFLCLIPGEAGNFPAAFREFAKYLLDHVDNRDAEAVVLAFGVFQASQKENFGMSDLEKYLGQKREDEGREERRREDKRWEDGKQEEEKLSGRKFPERKLPQGKLSEGSKLETCGEPELESFRRVKSDVQERDPRLGSAGKQEKDGMSSKKGKFTIRWRAIVICLMVALPVGIYLVLGLPALQMYCWPIVGAEVFLIAVSFGLDGKPAEKEKKMRAAETVQPEEWQVFLSDEAGRDESGETEEENEEEELQTVLLVGDEIDTECHRLAPIQRGEEIRIGYFPFLIGKNRQLADFCIDSPAVSRLHLRLDETEEGYQVTDLNSTNGTAVAGRPLGANESCAIRVGEELEIAGIRYRFL